MFLTGRLLTSGAETCKESAVTSWVLTLTSLSRPVSETLWSVSQFSDRFWPLEHSLRVGGSCLGEEERGGEGEGDGGGEGDGEGEKGGGESGGGGTEGLGGRGGGGGDCVSADVVSRSPLAASAWSSCDERGGGENIGVGVASSSSLSSSRRG